MKKLQNGQCKHEGSESEMPIAPEADANTYDGLQYNPSYTGCAPQRMELSFHRNAEGYWLGPLHVCGDFDLFYQPPSNDVPNWIKGLWVPAPGGQFELFVVSRDDVLFELEDIIESLSDILWISEDPEGIEAFRALLLLFWTELDAPHRRSRH